MARWKAWRCARAGGMGLEAGLGGEACKEASYTTEFLPGYTQARHRQAASGIQGWVDGGGGSCIQAGRSPLYYTVPGEARDTYLA